ncbi:helix-turn-helix domain-containing protein [Anaerotignum sp.]
MSDFAKNLKKYRKQKKYSQTKLAQYIHYGYTAIANYESGRNEPSIDVLILLANALDVTVDELVGAEKNEIEGDPHQNRI